MAKCACQGSFLDKFLQPSILILLNRENLHGFSLLKKLNENQIIDCSQIDPTGLYRTLKKMEEVGIIASCLEQAEPTKFRKVYHITADGRDCLINWKVTLMSYQKQIMSLSDAISESLGGGDGHEV